MDTNLILKSLDSLLQATEALQTELKAEKMVNPATELVEAALANVATIRTAVVGYAKHNWKQNTDNDLAARERHDLYALFTKINFAIDAYSKLGGDQISKVLSKELKRTKAASKELYTNLRQKLTLEQQQNLTTKK